MMSSLSTCLSVPYALGVLVRILQKEGTERYRRGDLSWELAQAVAEAELCPDVPLAGSRTRKAHGIIQSGSKELV